MVILAGTQGFTVTMESLMKFSTRVKQGVKTPSVLFPDIPGFGQLQKKVEEPFPQCEIED